MKKSDKTKKQIQLILLCIALSCLFAYCKLATPLIKRPPHSEMLDFIQNTVIHNPDVNKHLKSNDFTKKSLGNGDFSKGLNNFATLRSSNRFLIDRKDFVSPRQSLKIITNTSPSRIYYSKEKKFKILNSLPWNFQDNPTWLAISNKKTVHLSLYYKGLGPTIYINMLEKSGAAKPLASKELNSINKWTKVNIQETLPEQAKALQLEITVNKSELDAITHIDNIKFYVQ